MADLRENMTDNSAKDGTNDEINGAEVDANPNKIADVLDGSDTVALNQDGSLSIRNFEVSNVTAWTGSTINQGLRIRHDPASGTANDTDGIKLTFQGDNDKATAETIDYGIIECHFTDTTDGSEDGQFVFKCITAGSQVTALTLSGTAYTIPLPIQLNNTLTVGVDDTGHDVKLFGATSGSYWLWDESANQMIITGGSASISGDVVVGAITTIAGATGALTMTGAGSDITVNTNMFTVDATQGNTTIAGTLASGTVTVSSDLTLATGSITSASTAISFGDENLSTTGTLGAGATTVTSLLALSTGNDATARLTAQNTSNGNAAYASLQASSDAGNVTLWANGSGITPSGIFQPDAATLESVGMAAGFYVGTRDAAPLYLSTNNAARITINDSGMNGTLGATTPAAATVTTLTATDAMKMLLSDSAVDYANREAVLIIGRDSNPTNFLNRITSSNYGAGVADNTINFEVSNGASTFASVMTLNGAGNVGIGTASPSQLFEAQKDQNNVTYALLTNDTSAAASGVGYRLDAGGTNRGNLYAFSAGYTTSNQYVANAMLLEATTNLNLSALGANTIGLYTNSALRATIDASGNLGIGTASPVSPLTVIGISTFSRADATPVGTPVNIFDDAVFGSTDTANTGITIFGTGQTAIAFGDAGDADIGQVRYQHSTDAMEFMTNATVKATLDASGNLGLGVTPQATNANLTSFSIGGNGWFGAETTAAAGSNVGIAYNAYYSSAANYKHIIAASEEASLYSQANGQHLWYTATAQTAESVISWGTAKLTIANDGYLASYGDRAGGYIAGFSNDGNNANRYGIQIIAGADDASGDTYYVTCTDGDGDIVGYIWNTSGTFQLVDSSDATLKENITPTEIKGIDNLRQINVVDYDRKKSGCRVSGGFTAQDLLPLYPQAVAQPMNEDGTPGKMGVAKAELIAPIIKSVQELDGTMQTFMGRDLTREQTIKKLEARVAELEAKLAA